ncbi:MAG: hypothetical protein Q8Q14_00540 [Gemmatimonadales bacterium]|nr:hypothetical protein [Gemmatimonadales bacterium]
MDRLTATVGVAYRLWWHAPTAVYEDAGPPAVAPVLTVRHPTLGDLTPAFSRVAVDASVTALSADRRTLTTAALPALTSGLQGQQGGHAHLVTARHGVIPVQIRSFPTNTTVELAEPLGQALTVAAGDELRWSVYTAELGAGAGEPIETALARPIAWRVDWQEDHGAGVPRTRRRYEGLLDVVRQPFETGLNTRDVLVLVPSLAVQVPARQTSWQPQIDAARDLLVAWLRRDLRERGRREHDVSGAGFRLVHAFLTAYLVMQGHAGAGADRGAARDHYMDSAERQYATVMQSIPWVDDDGDGVVDEGETEVNPGPTARLGRSSFTSAPTRTFTRDMRL